MAKPLGLLSVVTGSSAVLALALGLLPGPLYAVGLLDLRTAFTLLLDGAPLVAIATIALGLVGLAIALWRQARTVAVTGVVAALVGAGVVFTVGQFERQASANPLHDVTTSLDDPPAFEALPPRGYEPGGMEARAAYPHPDWRLIHAEIYPDLTTLTLDLSLDEAFARALEAGETMGWTIEASAVTADLARIEAVDETGWFGFRDDIVVVIAPSSAAGVTVDARSVSRIGVGDVGKNAERLRGFLDLMQS